MTRPHRDTLITLGLALVAFAVYALVAPTGLTGADQGEYATLAGAPGVAHPPGYPLYVFYLRLLSPLPGLTVVHSTAIATALLGAVALAVYHRGLLNWGVAAVPAAVAALLVGFDYTIFSAHTHAEALALSNVFVAAIVWGAAPGSPGGVRRAALLGLFAGLGIANHQTIVFIAPLGLWGIYRAVTESTSVVATLGAGLGCIVVGFSPYVVLLLSTTECTDCYSWGNLQTLADVAHHFLRTDYGATNLTIGGEREPLRHWLAFGERFVRGSWGIVPAAVIAGAVVAWRENHEFFWVFGATLLSTSVLFIGLLDTPTTGMLGYTTARFYVVPLFVTVPFVALALSIDVARPSIRRLAFGAVVVALLAGNAVRVAEDHQGIIDAWVRDTLQPLPPDAIVFGMGDQRTLGIAYAQYAEGIRPDVDYIDGQLMAYDWFVDRIDRRLDLEMPRTDDDGIPIIAIVDAALKTGRPVFIIEFFVDELTKVPNYPTGTVIRLLPPGERPPHPRALAAANAETFDDFELQAAPDVVRNPWEEDLLRYYRRPWESIADVLRRLGDEEAAARADDVARTYSSE